MLHAFVGSDDDSVRREVQSPFREYVRSSVDLWRNQVPRLEKLTPHEEASLLDFAVERYYSNSALFGDPRRCADIVESVRDIGVGELACLIDFGVPNRQTMGSLERLAELNRRFNEPSAPAVTDAPLPAEAVNQVGLALLSTATSRRIAGVPTLLTDGPAPDWLHPDSLPEPRIEELFDTSRITPASPWIMLLLLLYFPVGALLCLARLALVLPWALLGPLLPLAASRAYWRVFCAAIGARIRVRGRNHLTQKPRVVVVNHVVNVFDTAAWMSVLPSAVLARYSVPFAPLFKRAMRQAQPIDADEARADIHRSLERDGRPILCFPEAATTNGRVGTLRFNPYLFSLEQPVTPVVLQVQRPLPIALTLLGQSFIGDFLWMLFSVWTTFQFDVLPPQKRAAGEGPRDFADRVQAVMARELGVEATRYTHEDKAALRAQVDNRPSMETA
jgi:1-acyl-sn-glycerol-3-phosphate acyltransferase